MQCGPPSRRPLRVLIPCPGLGIAERGFERVARDWFDSLRHHPGLDLTLVKGRGTVAGNEYTAPTISRNTALSHTVARRLDRHDFWLEQVVFSSTLQPLLLRLRPDVVMLSEWALARSMGIWRRGFQQRFRLLLCNGAAGMPPFPEGVDYIQQVTPELFERARARGEPGGRQTMLPHALHIEANYEPPRASERTALRRRLDLPLDRPVLLSVGALNRWKRMDYLVSEVASLADRPPFVVMLGAREAETEGVLETARNLLSPHGFSARTVPQPEVAAYYRAADVFALASGSEAFGLALVEALAHGLPVLAHDTPGARFVLGRHGYLADLTKRGALASMLTSLGEDDSVEARGDERHRYAYESFSWDVLMPRYVEMIERVASKATAR